MIGSVIGEIDHNGVVFEARCLETSQNFPDVIIIDAYGVAPPTEVEKEELVTEKTLMAIMGGNIPIWFGGWKCADSMRYLGFDVFDDISIECLYIASERRGPTLKVP